MHSGRFQTQSSYDLQNLQPVASGYFLETKWRMQCRITLAHVGAFTAHARRAMSSLAKTCLYSSPMNGQIYKRHTRFIMAETDGDSLRMRCCWLNTEDLLNATLVPKRESLFFDPAKNQVTLQCHHILKQPHGPGYVHAIPGYMCMTLIIISHV